MIGYFDENYEHFSGLRKLHYEPSFFFTALRRSQAVALNYAEMLTNYVLVEIWDQVARVLGFPLQRSER